MKNVNYIIELPLGIVNGKMQFVKFNAENIDIIHLNETEKPPVKIFMEIKKDKIEFIDKEI